MDRQQHRPSQWLGAILVLAIGGLALTQRLPARRPVAGATTALAPVTVDTGRSCTLEPPGFLRGRLFGAVNARLDWAGNDFQCSGMSRPDGRGVRLYFAQALPGQARLSVQISIDGQPASLEGREVPANVTIIDPSGGFFSSGGFDRCWTRVHGVRRQPGTTDVRIEGILYCVGALPSLQDTASLTLGDLHFAGRAAIDAG